MAESKDLPYARQEVLNKIENKKAKIVVTTVEALMQKMIARNTLFQNKIELKVGKTYSVEGIKQKLLNLGYERVDLVESRGQFSTRGDIIDVAISEKEGIRIEFWGDDIDSIRKFNVSTQRSSEMMQNTLIMPAHEFILEDSIENIVQRIKQDDRDLSEDIEKKITTKQKQSYENKIEEAKLQDIELIENGDYVSKIEKYFNYFYTKQETFVDYLHEDFIIFYDEISKINQRQDSILIENKNLMNALIEKEKYIPQSIQNLQKIEYVREDKQIIYLASQEIGAFKGANTKFKFNYRDVKYYKSEIELLIGDIIKWLNEKKQVIVLAGNKEEAQKFESLLEEKQVPYSITNLKNISGEGSTLRYRNCPKGNVPNEQSCCN